MKELEIIISEEENGEWLADTNLPGTPPIGRDKDWRVAVGMLMQRLMCERKEWEKLVHLPKWTVRSSNVDEVSDDM